MPIQHWKPVEQVIYCHCHFSQFDPGRMAGRWRSGAASARRPAAAVVGDQVMVAGEFVGKLGVPKT